MTQSTCGAVIVIVCTTLGCGEMGDAAGVLSVAPHSHVEAQTDERGRASATWIVTNLSTDTVTIAEVKKSCTCLSAIVEKSTLKPGEATAVTAHVVARRGEGAVVVEIVFACGGVRRSLYLGVKCIPVPPAITVHCVPGMVFLGKRQSGSTVPVTFAVCVQLAAHVPPQAAPSVECAGGFSRDSVTDWKTDDKGVRCAVLGQYDVPQEHGVFRASVAVDVPGFGQGTVLLWGTAE